MNLILSSLASAEVLRREIVSLRAEDASGYFGIRKGHADFLTTLVVTVLTWKMPNGDSQYCAVRRGILQVHDGSTIEIATHEAILDTDLQRLETTVLQALHERDEAERNSRTQSQQFEVRAVREMMRYLRPGRVHTVGGNHA